MGRSRRRRVAGSGGAGSVVGEVVEHLSEKDMCVCVCVDACRRAVGLANVLNFRMSQNVEVHVLQRLQRQAALHSLGASCLWV